MHHFPRWKVIVILVALIGGIAYAVPNLFSRQAVEAWPIYGTVLPHKQMNLGLDLQGGVHLLLEVELEQALRDRLEFVVDAVRLELRGATIGYTGLGVQNGAVRLQLRDPATAEQVRELLRDVSPGSEVTIVEGAVEIRPTEVELAQQQRSILEQSIEIVRRRIDETGVREPTIQRQGEDRILVQVPGETDPERIKDLLRAEAKMTFQLVDVNATPGAPGPGSVVLPSSDSEAASGGAREYVVERRVLVSGENLTDAQPTIYDGQPVVSFRFDSIGAKRFGDATQENVGRPFAIVLDKKVISAPVIEEPILGGSGIIRGGFTTQEASDLALLLRAGALPAPLTVLEERTVGADLGADSIEAGKFASMLGLALIVVALVLSYGIFGLFANIALIFNFILLIALMSLLEATLTLPGIAGMVLSLGMAVDANVLIYERIKEEIRAKRSPRPAIDAGYKAATNTITDANLTVLISTAFLYIFGSGTVKGFAVTLALGTIISMFTAVWVTRLVTEWWYNRTRPKVLPLAT